MAKTVNGIRFADDVDTSKIDWESDATPELVEALRKPAKIRITTMIDADVLDELKRAAGGTGYQTLLNQILRKMLVDRNEGEGVAILALRKAEKAERALKEVRKRLEGLVARVEGDLERQKAPSRSKKKKTRKRA